MSKYLVKVTVNKNIYKLKVKLNMTEWNFIIEWTVNMFGIHLFFYIYLNMHWLV